MTINADTAVDFSNQIRATIGSPHTSPTLTPDIQIETKTDANGNEVPGSAKITAVGLAVKTSITKVRFGMGRNVDADNKAIIDQMVAEIIAHEGRHRAIVEAAATTALAAAHKKFVGTGQTTAAQTGPLQDARVHDERPARGARRQGGPADGRGDPSARRQDHALAHQDGVGREVPLLDFFFYPLDRAALRRRSPTAPAMASPARAVPARAAIPASLHSKSSSAGLRRATVRLYAC